jgi:hypothetical protein
MSLDWLATLRQGVASLAGSYLRLLNVWRHRIKEAQ